MVERDRSRPTSFTSTVDMELIMCFVETILFYIVPTGCVCVKRYTGTER